MFKFLRKYNKVMLAVFGVLLMITFLIPQAFDRFSQQSGASGAVYGTLDDGETFTGADIERARRELRVIDTLGMGLPGLGQIRRPDHWHLLVHEAEAAGLVRTGQSLSIPEENLQSLMARSGERDASMVRTAYAKYVGIVELMNLFQTGGLYSDRRLKSAAARLVHQVFVQVVPIEAQADKVELEPTIEQLEQQLVKYADVLPGQGETGFGYKLPDRFKVEWITVSATAVRKAVEQSQEFDPVAQRLHWRRNPNKTFPTVEDGGAVPQVVKDDLLDTLTSEKLDEIAKDATAKLALNRRGLVEKDGYYVLPPDWDQKKLSFQQLAADVQKKYGIELPAYDSIGDRWIPVDEAGDIEGLGDTSTDKFGPNPIRFNQLIESLREFGRAGASVIPMQQDIAAPPLRGIDDSIYVFRVIAADASRKPAGLDEVRDAVVADLKRQAHFEQLAAAAAEIEKRAEEGGLLALAMENNTAVHNANVALTDSYLMQQRLQFNMPLEVEPTPLPVIGVDREATEAIIDHALSLPAQTPIDDLPEDQRIFVVPVKGKLAVLAVRVMRQNPLSREKFTDLAQGGAIQQLINGEESGEGIALATAFGFDAIAARHKYVPSRETPEEDAAEEPATGG